MEVAEDLPSSLKIVAYNCWGIKWISKFRDARFPEIGNSLLAAKPDIVGLQECFTETDYGYIREKTKDILPYGKRYFSGSFGCGLAILSRWPIEESSMLPYTLNGRPTAFYRGDWYVGKGVAHARIRIGPAKSDIAEVFCTHLHAPYAAEPKDSYICHRTAQAWEIAKLMRYAVERGHLTIGLGDFNMRPLSLAHRIIESHSLTRDVWRIIHPDSSLGSTTDKLERARNVRLPNASFNLLENGTTCDSILNTWRWNKAERKQLEHGHEIQKLPTDIDRKAKRLDYIFVGHSNADIWYLRDTCVGMMDRHPKLRCSLSDHFSVEATLLRRSRATSDRSSTSDSNFAITPLPFGLPETAYYEIGCMIEKYRQREKRQRIFRLSHGIGQLLISIVCFIAIWWSPTNFVSFLLLLFSTVGFGAGILDALIGGLFMSSELRFLVEFEWEIATAKALVQNRFSMTEQGRSQVIVPNNVAETQQIHNIYSSTTEEP